jgi:hypothetical protein
MFDCKDGSWGTEYTWRATYKTEWRARDESIKDIFVGIVRGYNHTLKIAYQDSQQALQQQIAQAFSEKKEHANKLEEVTRREQNLRAQVSQLKACLSSLCYSLWGGAYTQETRI